MFQTHGNHCTGGTEGSQVDQTGQGSFAFVTPEPVHNHRVQPSESARSTSSAAQIAEMENLIKSRDAQIAQMQQAMRAAGLLPDDVGGMDGFQEEEAHSSSMCREPSVVNIVHEGSTFKTFLGCKPPTFKEGEDSLACVRWLRKMEQTFRSAQFTAEQKVNYVVRMYEGEALEWWDLVDQTLSEATRKTMTWERFSKKVKERYCSAGAMHRVEREFVLAPANKDRNYIDTFNEKLQFARVYCPTEEKLVSHYVEGLPYEYRATVRLQTTIEAAMDEARKVEDDFGKARLSPQRSREIDDKPVYCKKCHSSHTGKIGHRFEDCKSTEPMCYNCREMGHISTRCPNPKVQAGAGGRKDEVRKVEARLFNMTAEDKI
ncbi:hypothetical protein LXL04_015828 [Taraxacum kok-saghyz]